MTQAFFARCLNFELFSTSYFKVQVHQEGELFASVLPLCHKLCHHKYQTSKLSQATTECLIYFFNMNSVREDIPQRNMQLMESSPQSTRHILTIFISFFSKTAHTRNLYNFAKHVSDMKALFDHACN